MYKNFSKVFSGVALAQILNFALSPILTRIYSPNEFGIQNLIVVISTILASFSSLSLHFAIPVMVSNIKSVMMSNISIAISLLFSLFLLFILLLAYSFGVFEANHYLYIPLYVFVYSTFFVFNQLMTQRSLFFLIGAVALLQVIIASSLKICIGLFYPYADVFIISNIIAMVSCLLLMGIKIEKWKWYIFSTLFKSRKFVHVLIVKNKDLIFFRTPQVALNAFSSFLPVIFIAILYDDVTLGYISLAITVIQAPIIVIGNSIVQICSRYLSDASVHPLVIAQRFRKITGLILFATVLPCSVFSYFSADIFAFIFGENWRRSGDFAGVLSLLLFFILVSRPAIPLITILKKEIFFLKFEFISVSIKVLAVFFVDKLYGSVVLDLLVFGVVSSIFYVYLISSVYRKLLADA